MPQKKSKMQEYRDGGEGFIKWAEDHIYLEITPIGSTIKQWVPLGALPEDKHPETGRSYKDMWEGQKEVARQALVMENGVFKHKLIIVSWPRGEGKTYLVCMILMWRFFCWPGMEIVLCANSKEQTKFVQFNIVKSIIENSPKLKKIVGERNIQEKQIRLTDRDENTTNFIKSISSFSGIVSNIDIYAFTEIFQMKNPEFFQQVDGSIRNITNAFGLVDSTVSPKDHILYHLYRSKKEKKPGTESIFFSYRFSKTGHYKDYWNPSQTQAQLESYRIKQALGGAFARYFLNLWSAGADKVFQPEDIDAMYYLGANDEFLNHGQVVKLVKKRQEIIDGDKKISDGGLFPDDHSVQIATIDRSLVPVANTYQLGRNGISTMAPVEILEALGDMFDTDWAILAGVDLADPMKKRTAARTIYAVLAKGLVGSRSDPNAAIVLMPDTEPITGYQQEEIVAQLSYIYFLLYVKNIEDHSVESLKAEILKTNIEYEIDMLAGERYGMTDIVTWLGENDIDSEIVYPTYDKQLLAFTEFYGVVRTGRFKTPPTAIHGSKEPDLMREEMDHFDHEPAEGRKSGWFGSPEKKLKYGVQDDLVYSVAWGIHGGRLLTPEHFRPRVSEPYFGTMFQPTDLVGRW